MIWLGSSVITMYFFFTLWLRKGLGKNEFEASHSPKKNFNLNSNEFLSVIVPFRNEEKRISFLLKSLKTQSLSNLEFEIIFVDDQSKDKTVEVVEDFIGVNSDLNARLFQIPKGSFSNKKIAIELGVSYAKGNFIVQTDADTWANSKWLNSIQKFILKSQFDLLILPVFIKSNNSLISSFDSMEYASLQAIGFGMATQDYPIICSASNLAYHKSFFENVKQKRRDGDISSGDDIFLLQAAINGKFKIETLLNKDVVVYTSSLNNWKDFFAQRKRWISKNSSIKDPVYQIVALLGFFSNLLVLFVFAIRPSYGASLLLLKFIADYLLFKKYYSRISEDFNSFSFINNSIIYPFYLVYVVLAAYSTKNSWKGRKVET